MKSITLLLALLVLPGSACAQNAPKTQPKPGKAQTGKPQPTKLQPQPSKAQPTQPSVKPAETPRGGAKVEIVAAQATVTVRAVVEVTGGRFTLGEIADIQSADTELAAQLTKLEIGTSPLPGMSRNLMPGDITVKLRGARLDNPRVTIIAPPAIRVSRTRNDVPPAEITQAAMPIAQKAVEHLTDATLEPQPLAQPVTLPTGRVVLIAGAHRGEPENGTIYVPVSLNVDGKLAQTVEIAFRVRRKMRVVVANRTIDVNETIKEEDVSLVSIELPSGFTRPVKELKEVVGKRAKRRLAGNAPVSAAHLETPPDLTANTRVTIEYVIGPVRISAPGITRQAGAIGDLIRVFATDTKKEMEAVVVDSHTVRISDTDEKPDTDEKQETP
jgi:flagellar basal body P-ring formation protein FlgA